MRTLIWVLRVMAQSVGYAASVRKLPLLILLALAPLLVLLAFLAGAAAPLVVYPFV